MASLPDFFLPNLGPNCLQQLHVSTDNSSGQRVKDQLWYVSQEII